MSIPFRHRKLGYIALQVRDIEKSTTFATDVFGLDLVCERADGSRSFRGSRAYHDVILTPAKAPAFVRSSWELEFDAELDVAFKYFKELGRSPAWVSDKECADLQLERAFRMTDPVLGATWEYYAEMTNLQAPRTNRLTGFQGGKHFGLLVPNCKAMADYIVENMGFLVSDYFEGPVASLLRAWPNPNHHSIGLFQSSGPTRFQHVAFMVESIDDIGRLFNRVKRMGVEVQWGIGRHPTSGSIHLYIYDPDLFVWEYTFGMEQFPEQGARPPRRMSKMPEEYDLWGALPDTSRASEFPLVLTSA